MNDTAPHQIEPELKKKTPRTLYHGFPWWKLSWFPVIAVVLLSSVIGEEAKYQREEGLWKALSQQGEMKSGKITGVAEIKSGGRNSITRTIYRFTYSVGGQTFSGSLERTGMRLGETPGGPVCVLYLPETPAFHFAQRGSEISLAQLREACAKKIWKENVTSGLQLGLILVFLLFLGLGAWGHYRALRTGRELLMHGRYARGVVTQCIRSRANSIEVVYTVEGQKYKITELLPRNLENLLAAGAWLTVLDLPGKPAQGRVYRVLVPKRNPLLSPAAC